VSDERETLAHEMALLAEHRYLNSDTGDGIIEMVEPWCAELAHLRRERDRYKAALEQISGGMMGTMAAYSYARDVALRALGYKK